MTQTIEVIIDTKGQSQIQTKGFAGSSCQAASKFLEEALGVKLSDNPTAEFYQTQPAHEHLQQKGNS